MDGSFRDAGQLGTGKKDAVFRVQLRPRNGMLTKERADAAIVVALQADVKGELRS